MESEYFRTVYEQTYRDLLRYVVIKTRSANDVEDIMQQAYASFYRRIVRHGHADIKNPKAFLTAVVNTELKKYYRFRILRRQNETDADTEQLGGDGDWEEASFRRALTDRVWELVRQAPADSYRAFVLYYTFDMSLEEIAAALSTSVTAVKSRLYRLRQSIREELREEMKA